MELEYRRKMSAVAKKEAALAAQHKAVERKAEQVARVAEGVRREKARVAAAAAAESERRALREAQEAVERAAVAERKAVELANARKAAAAVVGATKDPTAANDSKTKAFASAVYGMFSRRQQRTAPTPLSARKQFELSLVRYPASGVTLFGLALACQFLEDTECQNDNEAKAKAAWADANFMNR